MCMYALQANIGRVTLPYAGVKKKGALGADMWPTKIGAVTLTYAGIGATQTYCELTGHCDSLGGDMWRTVIAVSSTAPLATAGAG